jgi:hypothetical protein
MQVGRDDTGVGKFRKRLPLFWVEALLATQHPVLTALLAAFFLSIERREIARKAAETQSRDEEGVGSLRCANSLQA